MSTMTKSACIPVSSSAGLPDKLLQVSTFGKTPGFHRQDSNRLLASAHEGKVVAYKNMLSNDIHVDATTMDTGSEPRYEALKERAVAVQTGAPLTPKMIAHSNARFTNIAALAVEVEFAPKVEMPVVEPEIVAQSLHVEQAPPTPSKMDELIALQKQTNELLAQQLNAWKSQPPEAAAA